jgi:hypothetical protein
MLPGDLLDRVNADAANRRADQEVQARGMKPIDQGVSPPEIRSGPEVRRCLNIRTYRCHQHPSMESPSRRSLNVTLSSAVRPIVWGTALRAPFEPA